MGIFGRGKEEEKRAEEYNEQMALTEQTRQGAMPEEQMNALGQLYYMMKDDQVTYILWENKQLRNLIPAFSPLNQMSNISEKEARIRRLKYKLLLLKQKGYMNTKKYAEGGATLISSLDLLSRTYTTDAVHGWKGKILTEQTKIIRTEVVKRKKKGMLPF